MYSEAGPGCPRSMPGSYSRGQAGYSPGAGRLWQPWRTRDRLGQRGGYLPKNQKNSDAYRRRARRAGRVGGAQGNIPPIFWGGVGVRVGGYGD
jgi:hypothetical protein